VALEIAALEGHPESQTEQRPSSFLHRKVASGMAAPGEDAS
jgi:hypothetical protein